MALVDAVDSNVTGLRIAEEDSFGIVSGDEVWEVFEPNSYSDFGGNFTLTPRNPINPDRQRKKGVITDLDAAGGFSTDLTQTNMQSILQGFFLADLRPKGEEVPTAATGTTDLFDVASTEGFKVGDLILSSGWDEAGNNGVMEITAIVTDTTIEVLNETLITQAAPPAGVNLVVVGFLHGSAELDVDKSGGTFPAYVSVAGVDWTTLGLNIGEFIYVGGDTATSDFVGAENNGFKRIRSISATRLEVDKSEVTMSDETGTGLVVEMYFGRVLKNELAGSIVKRTYQLERTLGAPNDNVPEETQVEYVTKAFPNEATFNIPNSDKLTVDLTWLAGGHEVFAGDHATETLTMAGVAVNDEVAVIGTKTYTMKTASPTADGDVLIGADQTASMLNLSRAINLGAGAGTLYGAVTTLHPDVSAVPSAATCICTAKVAGLNGNLIAATTDFTSGDWDNGDTTFLGGLGAKQGTRPALVDSDAFNTSSDFTRKRIAVHVDGTEAPVPLFAFMEEISITLNNNGGQNKAVGVLGSFAIPAGTFEIGGSITGYFSDIAAVAAISGNSNVTLDMQLAKNNAGIAMDMPLIALGDGRLNVEQDQSIKIPVTMDAATAKLIDAALDHTLMLVFYDYLPTVAE